MKRGSEFSYLGIEDALAGVMVWTCTGVSCQQGDSAVLQCVQCWLELYTFLVQPSVLMQAAVAT